MICQPVQLPSVGSQCTQVFLQGQVVQRFWHKPSDVAGWHVQAHQECQRRGHVYLPNYRKLAGGLARSVERLALAHHIRFRSCINYM